jgi:hypothetical protein
MDTYRDAEQLGQPLHTRSCRKSLYSWAITIRAGKGGVRRPNCDGLSGGRDGYAMTAEPAGEAEGDQIGEFMRKSVLAGCNGML